MGMSRSTLIAIGGGGVSAIASLAGQFGVPGAVLVACLAPLPLMAVGLALGPKAAAVAAASGIVFALTVGGVAAATVYASLHALPAALVVERALARGSWAGNDGARAAGVALASLAVFVTALAGAIAVIGADGAGIEPAVRGFLDQGVALTMSGLPADARERFVDTAAPMFLGLTGVSWQLLIAMNGVAAQRLVSRRGQAVRPTPEWSKLTVPDWFAWPLVGAAAISLVTGGDAQYLARNAAMILAVPYFFLGLTVVHALARRSAVKGLLLGVFYVVLVFFTLVAGAVVAGLGMFEQWVGLRERIAAPAARKE